MTKTLNYKLLYKTTEIECFQEPERRVLRNKQYAQNDIHTISLSLGFSKGKCFVFWMMDLHAFFNISGEFIWPLKNDDKTILAYFDSWYIEHGQKKETERTAVLTVTIWNLETICKSIL